MQKVEVPILKAGDYLMNEFDIGTKIDESMVVTIRKMVVRNT